MGASSSGDNREWQQLDLSTPRVEYDGTGKGGYYPGGDVMYQMLTKRYGAKKRWPSEEEHYKGARLGEYARPLIMDRNVLGYLNKAPVPLGASEDELALMAQASAAARRATEAAVYARSAADKADQFLQAGIRKAARVLKDPPINVKPTADVFPFYSASMPVEPQLLELLPGLDSASRPAADGTTHVQRRRSRRCRAAACACAHCKSGAVGHLRSAATKEATPGFASTGADSAIVHTYENLCASTLRRTESRDRGVQICASFLETEVRVR
eukprot:TRINITY_DN66072_c0_g1_i1.p1 TRINITY_DN66072_c0_g1~~TRINITY_DN66072_c0_g1_i1.p1  ORF type:complete len:270 (-),score=37.93 TRINITY_DN66072_c0_g1_i1:10-819(-)